jgi:hypothetical protein
MNRENTDITIRWKNDCGEILYEETVPAKIVWDIIQTDPRADTNTYVLPNKSVLNIEAFVRWYTGTSTPVAFA